MKFFDVKVGAAALFALASASGSANLKPAQAIGHESTPAQIKTRKPDKEEKANAQFKMNERSKNFTENKGQWPSFAKFEHRSPSVDTWLTSTGVRINFHQSGAAKNVGHVIGLDFVGVPKTQWVGKDDARMDRGFYPKGKKQFVLARSYKKVVDQNLYPGIDCVYYPDGKQARFDFHVKPGADAAMIAMKTRGAKKFGVAKNGDLTFQTALGELNLGKLIAYQQANGVRTQVPAKFAVNGDTVSFKLGAYDHSRELVIDPLIYGTLWGGEGDWDEVHAVATDNAEGLYIVGVTRASDFPANFGPYFLTPLGTQNCFVAKLQGDVYGRDYAAMFGGTKIDSADYVQIDRANNVWIAGTTTAQDFPSTANAGRDSIWTIRKDSSANNGTVTVSITGSLGIGGFATLPYNFTAAQLMAAIPSVTAVDLSQNGTTLIQVRVANPAKIRSISIDSTGLWPKYISSRPGLSRYWRLAPGQTAPTGGTFVLKGTLVNGNPFSDTFPLNVDATTITTTLNTQEGNGSTAWTGASSPALLPKTGSLPNFAQIIRVPTGATINPVVDSTNLTPAGATVTLAQGFTALSFRSDTSRTIPFAGTANFTLTNGATIVTVGASAAPRVTPASVESVITGVLNAIQGTDVYADVVGGTTNGVPDGTMFVTMWGQNNALIGVTVDDSNLLPKPKYLAYQGRYGFLMRWLNTGNALGLPTVAPLDPEFGNEKVMTWGADQGDTTINGFNVYKSADTPSSEDVPFYLAGSNGVYTFGGGGRSSFIGGASMESYPVSVFSSNNGAPIGFTLKDSDGSAWAGQASYRLRLSFKNSTSQFAVNTGASGYINSGANGGLDQRAANLVQVRGSTVDKDGNHIIAGTVYGGNEDTSANPNPTFTTTAGVFTEGRLLRLTDMFVRNYPLAGGEAKYSAIVGGNDLDVAAGWDLDRFTRLSPDPRASSVNSLTTETPVRREIITGSCVTTDSNGDIYLAGITFSFNFPRTRGVYGEVFGSGHQTTVTKISRDFTQLLYSTHLRTSLQAYPAGIGVGPSGIAYITGNIHPNSVGFPTGPPPPDLTTFDFTSVESSSITTTPDAVRNAYTFTGFPTQDGYLTVLNNTGTDVLYSSYIGGDLDDRVWQPYVDKFGDCWIAGYTCARRDYIFGAQLSPTLREAFAGMPNQITGLAYKVVPDNSLDQEVDDSGALVPYAYSFLDRIFSHPAETWPPYSFWPYFSESRDGFLQRYRFTLPILTAITYNKPTLAGGLNNVATGTVSTNIPAPAPGVNLTLKMGTNQAASFSPVGAVYQTTVTIPTGATSVSFPVYTNPVSTNTNVDVTANLEGNILTGRLVVAPWLSSIAVSPNTQVGGNNVQGRVRIFEAAPAGGVTISLSTGDTTLATVKNPTVQVLQGQTEAAFDITTFGVSVNKTVSINGAFSGVGVSQLLTLTPADVFTLTFDPARLSAGSSTIGTVKLTGKPDPNNPVKVKIDVSQLGAGFVATPSTLIFGQTQSAKVVATTDTTLAGATGTIDGQSLSIGDVVLLTGQAKGVQNGPWVVAAAAWTRPSWYATGSVVSGVDVSITAGSSNAGTTWELTGQASTVDTTATVWTASGDTSVRTFTLQTPFSSKTILGNVVATNIATGASAPPAAVQVDPLNVTAISVNTPTTVTGGSTATLSVTLDGAAGKGGAVVHVVASSATSPIPARVQGSDGVFATDVRVLVPEGATTATYNIQTDALANTATVNFSADRGTGAGFPAPVTTATPLTIQGVGYDFSLSVASVSGGGVAVGTVTLTGPAPTGGLTVYLFAQDSTGANSTVASVPTSISIAAGSSTGTFQVTTSAVATTQTSVIGASLNAGAPVIKHNLEIRARSLVSIGFSPNRVRGGRQDTNCRVTIDTPAGDKGVTVLLSSSNTDIANVPTSIVIKPGQTYASFTVVTNMVSRELATTVTASLQDNPAAQVTATLTVRK